MAFLESSDITMKSIHSFVSSNIETNLSQTDYFSQQDIKKIVNLSGIEQRSIFLSSPSEVFTQAVQKTMEYEKINKDEIECLICIYQLGDYLLPGTSFIVHKNLGLNSDTYCLDINLGCSAFGYGITVISRMLMNSNKKGILVVGDILSQKINKKDKDRLIMGDSVSVTILENVKNNNKTYALLKSIPKNYDSLIIKNGGLKNNYLNNSIDDYFHMNGLNVMSFVMSDVCKTINEMITKLNINLEEIDYIFLHQANEFIVNYIRKKLRFDKNKVPINVKFFGNTSGASIPLLMTQTISKEITDANILICGFGTGLSISCLFTKIESLKTKHTILKELNCQHI